MWVEYRVCGLEEPRYWPQPRLLGLGLHALHCVCPRSASQLPATMPQPLCSTPATQEHVSAAAREHHATTTAAQQAKEEEYSQAQPNSPVLPLPNRPACKAARHSSPISLPCCISALLPPLAWLCSRLHLASIIQC